MKAVVVSRPWYRDLLESHVESTSSFGALADAAMARARATLAQALLGELDEDTTRAWTELKHSLVARVGRRASDPARATTERLIDAYVEHRAGLLSQRPRSEKEDGALLVQVAKQTLKRVGHLLVDDDDAHHEVLPKRSDGPRRDGPGGSHGGQPTILIDDQDNPTREEPPSDIFGEPIDSVNWVLTESVAHIRCDEETPERGSDDIVFSGFYVYRDERKRLAIRPVERDFDAGTIHFYDGVDDTPPHARVRITPDMPRSLYLSTHVLTESDQWTEVAESIAGFLQRAIERPLTNIVGAAAGAFAGGVAGAGASALGSAADAAIDVLSNGLMSKVAREVHDTIYGMISAIGKAGNIVFEPWITGAFITWKMIGGEQVPRWKVQHTVPRRFLRNAVPEGSNPMEGQGTLRPGRFAGMDDVAIRPSVYDRDQYPEITGRYSYMSSVNVARILGST